MGQKENQMRSEKYETNFHLFSLKHSMLNSKECRKAVEHIVIYLLIIFVLQRNIYSNPLAIFKSGYLFRYTDTVAYYLP
jgi:hypothetical protein